MSHSKFINTIVMSHATSISIITRLLAGTTPITHPAILPVFDSHRVTLLCNTCPAAISRGGIGDGGDEEREENKCGGGA
jgi:hypothetical protein